METILAENVTVEMIHNDFYLQQESILRLQKREIDNDLKIKHENLIKLGVYFYNNFFRKYKELEDEIQIHNEIVDLQPMCQYYKNKYPFYKVIDRYSVEKLCDKYNLCLNVISEFVEDIPDKNIREILNAKEKIDKSDIIFWDIQKIYQASKNRHAEIMLIAPYEYFNRVEKEKPNYIPKELLKNRNVNDPIALMPVKHELKQVKFPYNSNPKLYLIMSAWGEEANDELVINEKLN